MAELDTYQLGNGKRLFRSGFTPKRYRLADSLVTSAGVVMLTYARAEQSTA